MGNIVDASDQPVAGATFRLVLDRISEEKFIEEGPRARRTRTAAYLTWIDCEETGGITDSPGPCSPKSRHLTLSVETRDFRTKLAVFRLEDLNLVKDAGGGLLQVPTSN